jgi:hypothetical protein
MDISRAPTLHAIEARLAVGLGWKAERGGESGFDLISPDRRMVLDLKLGHSGARDLHAALIRLAFVAARTPNLQWAILLADFPRMSAKRIAEEWHLLRNLLRPEVAKPLALIARRRPPVRPFLHWRHPPERRPREGAGRRPGRKC